MFKLLILPYSILFGLAFGSFLNVIIYRTHNDEEWWRGRSKCPVCHKELTWRELIPVFSFLFQKGKCKHCNTKISWQYPIVELASAFLVTFIFYKFGLNLQSIIWALIGELLLASFVSDLLYMELPDIFTLPAIILSAAYQLISNDQSFNSLLFGVGFGFLFFAAQYVFTKGQGIGSGDIRLGVLIGMLLGWPLTAISIMISYVGGSIVSIFLLATKKMTMKSALPLGVFLIPGLMVVFLVKSEVLLRLMRYWGV